MPTLLVVHRSLAAIDREAVARLVAELRRRGHAVVSTDERAGLVGRTLARFERDADAADHVVLVDPIAWWTRGPAGDPIEQALRERIELCRANAVARYVVVHEPSRARTKLDGLLAELPTFVLPDAGPALLDHLAQPGARLLAPNTRGSLRRPSPWIERPALDAALDRAIADSGATPRRRVVWVRGGIGTGKTCLLDRALDRREAAGRATVAHFARPGLAATLRPGALLERIAADLGRARLDDLRELSGRPGRATVILIDGLEQLHDLEPVCASLVDLPDNVIAIVASRPLAPGLLESITPAIDLDAPDWAAERRALVDALLAEALSDLRGRELDEYEVPPRLLASLERAFGRLLELAQPERRAVLKGLGLVRAALQPLPRLLLAHAGGAEIVAALERHASEWVRSDGEQFELGHPFAARFLGPELDGERTGPHEAILAAGESLRRRGRLDAASERYLTSVIEQRMSLLERETQQVARLVEHAAAGTLEQVLARAVEAVPPERAPLFAAMRDIARQQLSRLRADPRALPGVWWTELVARGFTPATLDAELVWSDLRPTIRLQSPRSRIDSCERILAGHAGAVRGCGLSDDASLAITVGLDSSLRVWDPRAGVELARVELDTWARACALTPDGSLAVAHRGKQVLILDVRTQAVIAEHDDHQVNVTALAISRDGAWVLSGDLDGVAVIWNLSTHHRARAHTHDGYINAAAISPDGRFGATGADDDRVVLWDLDSGSSAVLAKHSSSVNAVAFNRDGTRLVSITHSQARVWEPRTRTEVRRVELDGQKNCAAAVVVGELGEVVSAEADERVLRWTLADGMITSRYFAHPAAMTCIAATPDGEWVLTGGVDKVARLWRGDDREREFAEAAQPVWALEPGEAPDTVWVASHSETRLVALAEREVVVKLARRASAYGLACVGGSVFAVGGDCSLVRYASATGSEQAQWRRDGDWLRAVAIDLERERIVVAGDDKTIFVLPLSLDDVICSLSGHDGWIYALALTPEGRVVAIDSQGALKLWDLERRRAVLELSTHSVKMALYALVLAGRGALAVVAGVTGIIAIYALATGELTGSMTGHEGAIRGLALHRDERVLASVGDDMTLRLWSLPDGRELACHAAGSRLTRVAFVGERVVAGDSSGELLIFAVDWSTIPA